MPLRLLVLLALLAAAARPAPAQAIRLEAEATPLAEVLLELAVQAGVDVVFAQDLVEGRAVSGRYLGDEAEGALATVLRGSGLRAVRLRPGQYVVVPEEPAPAEERRGTLAGSVLDAASGEVLPGAHVVLAGLGLGTVTNPAGYFAIPRLPAGRYLVRASYVGYRTAEVALAVEPEAEGALPEIRLAPQPVRGADVVVEGAEGERADLLPVPSTEAVGVRAAAGLPAFLGESDLFAALERLPGVGRASEGGGELVVRGAEAHFNRYLLDGAPVIHPWHTFGLFSTFQPEALKHVRLYKGSLPAEHGGGLSAVLDVEMKDGGGERSGGVLALSPVSLRGVAEVPLGRGASLMLTGRRTYLDLLLSPRLRAGADPLSFGGEGAGEAQEIGYYFFDAGAKLSLRPAPGHRLSLSIYEGGDDLAADVPFLSLFDPAPEATSPLGLRLNYGWGNRVASARYRYLHGRELFLTATAYGSRYRAEERAFARPTAAASVDTDYRVRFAEYGLRLDADYYLALEHQLRAGLHLAGRDFTSTLEEEVRRVAGQPEVRSEADLVRALEAALYVQDTWQPGPRWQLQPGLRLEVFSLGPYVALNPRLHARYVLARGRLFLRAGLSRQTQALHRLRDRYSFTYDLASSRWVPASRRVRPAVGWQAAAGLEWAPAEGLALGLDAYGRYLTDVLLPADEFRVKDGIEGPGILPGALLEQYVAATGRGFGLEASARWERGPWRLGLAYAWSRAQERPPGELWRRARYDAPHALEILLQREGRRWTAALAIALRSGYPVTVPTARYSLGDPLGDGAPVRYLHRPEIHNGRLPLYARADLSFGYGFRLLGLDWAAQAQAYNLLNWRNTVGQRFSPNGSAVAPDDVHGLPLLPMISLKAAW